MTYAHSHTAQSVIFRARQRSAREHSFSSVLVFYATFALGPYSPAVRFGCKCSLVHFPRFDFLPMESGTVTAEQCETWGFLRAKTRRGRAQFFLKELTLGVSVWWQWCSFLLDFQEELPNRSKTVSPCEHSVQNTIPRQLRLNSHMILFLSRTL